ncbi:ACE [Acanthosepion pharaonis]|uniref:ACE n=1 Tax=Acanthosepion pharaonis TaxID=158019 RepID=A0A812ATA7_ACAPH|nr:ACE [Sepia pharaonis]
MSIVAFLSDVTSLFRYETEEIQNLIEEEAGHFFPGKNNLDTMLQKESTVRDWLRRVNRASRWYNEKLSQATWNYETNITKTSSEQLANLSEWFDQWTLRRAEEARQYLKDQYRFKQDTFRQLKFRAMSATPDNAGILKQIYSQREHMATAYASAKVCRITKCMSLEPELIKIMAESRDPDELLWAWHGWRNAAGRPVRNNFKTYMELLNVGAKQNGIFFYLLRTTKPFHFFPFAHCSRIVGEAYIGGKKEHQLQVGLLVGGGTGLLKLFSFLPRFFPRLHSSREFLVTPSVAFAYNR